MSNPFYTFSPMFVPGSLARSGDVNTQFSLVQNGFDKVNAGQLGIGTDSGSANTVLLDMSTPRTVYTNGDEYIFMAAAQNTGATTIKVDGLGTLPLVRFNGTALQAGDLILNTWYSGRYSSALNSIEITSPTAYTSAAGIVSTAAPTHKVGLAAAGGVSINVLPVDATFALDPSIAPTWTSAHIFSAAATFNGASIGGSAPGTWTGQQIFDASGVPAVEIGAASGQIQLNSSGATTRFIITDGSAAATNSLAIQAGAGSTAFGGGLVLYAGANATNPGGVWLGTASGSGSINFGAGGIGPGSTYMSIAHGGNVTLNAPSSGTTATISAVSNAAAVSFLGPNTGQGFNIDFFDTTASVARGFIGIGTSTVSAGVAATDFAISPGVGGSVVIGTSNGTAIGTRFGPNGNVTINAPSSGPALTANGVAGQAAAILSPGSSASVGLRVADPGTNGIAADIDTTNTEASLRAGGTGATLGLYTAGSVRLAISNAGNVTLNAPGSGQHSINTFGQTTALVIGVQSSGTQSGWMQFNDTTNANAVRGYIGSGSSLFTGAALGDFGIASATGVLRLSGNAGSNTALLINATNNVSINNPGSGVAFTVNGASSANAAEIQGSATTGASFGLRIDAGTNSSDRALYVGNAATTVQYFSVRGDGFVFGNDGTSLLELGYKDTPLNAPGTTYTLVAADRGKTINISASSTITIPSGVFSGGAVISFGLQSGTCTLAQGSGLTLLWAGNGLTSGSRTATAASLSTVVFLTSTLALISGAGLS